MVERRTENPCVASPILALGISEVLTENPGACPTPANEMSMVWDRQGACPERVQRAEGILAPGISSHQDKLRTENANFSYEPLGE